MSGVTLNILIESALLMRPHHQQRLGLQAKRYCRAITNRFCAGFPEENHEDVLGQAFAELMIAGPEALANRSGLAVYRRAIFAAIRVVRAENAPAGQRTRRAPPGTPPSKVAAEDIGRIVDSQMIPRIMVEDLGGLRVDFDLLESASAAAAVKQMEDRVDAEWALRRAPPDVAATLRLICLDGELVETAAEAVGLSRFVLHRRMTAFTAFWRSAA